MHVALLTLDFPPYRTSGLTVYAEFLACALVDHGHSVTVVTSQRPDSKRTEEAAWTSRVRVVRLTIGALDWLGFGWQAARHLHAHRSEYDAVHFVDIHFAYAYRGPYTASALQSFRQRLTSSPRGPYHTNWRNYVFRSVYYRIALHGMERPSVRRALHIIATSDSTRQEFINHYSVQPDGISVLPIGVDIRRFSSQLHKLEARSQLSLPLDDPLVLYVGFSTPRKGVEFLARALSVMDSRPHLVMVGKWESGYRDVFLSALGQARNRVTLAGYVPDTELPTYFAAADVFVLPTLLEGFGIPLIEAMASGLPVVTTSAGSADEVVGDAGLVVPAADSESLARTLDRVILEPQLASSLAARGRHRVQLYENDRVGDQFEELFRQVWGSDDGKSD